MGNFTHIYSNAARCDVKIKKKLAKTITLQKKAIRLMTFANRDAHSSPLFKKLKILKLSDIVLYNNVNFVHRSLNGNIPQPFEDYFHQLESNHQYYTTRNPNSLCSIPHGSIKVIDEKIGTVQHHCVVDWNTILKRLSDRFSPINWLKELNAKNFKETVNANLISLY